MAPWGVAAIEAVTEMVKALGNAATTIKSIDAKGHQLMLPLLSEPLNDVDVLTREVLMNEKDSHLGSEALQRFSLVLKLTQQQLKV